MRSLFVSGVVSVCLFAAGCGPTIEPYDMSAIGENPVGRRNLAANENSQPRADAANDIVPSNADRPAAAPSDTVNATPPADLESAPQAQDSAKTESTPPMTDDQTTGLEPSARAPSNNPPASPPQAPAPAARDDFTPGLDSQDLAAADQASAPTQTAGKAISASDDLQAFGRGQPAGSAEGDAPLSDEARGAGGRGRTLEPGTESESPGGAAASEPQSFLQMAELSFQAFDERAGERFLYAHWLVDDQAKDEFPFEWVKGLKEPRLFVRWGVAVVLDTPEDYLDAPPVIGTPLAASTNPTRSSSGTAQRTNRGRRQMLSDADGGVVEATPGAVSGARSGAARFSSPVDSLQYCTGDFGDRLLKRFDMRRLSNPPYFGKMVAHVAAQPKSNAANPARAATPARGGGRAAMLAEADAVGAPTQAAVTTASGQDQNGSRWTSPDPRFTAGTLIPGVFFLGVDADKSEKRFVELSKQMGLDVLIVFEVNVNTRRTGNATSSTSATIHILKTGETQKTSSLNNETVAKARGKNPAATDDPVELELDKLFAKFSDIQLKTDAMPPLNPEVVLKRVGMISTDTNPLAAIVEVVNYWRAGLLDETMCLDIVSSATDEETAKAILTGSADERSTALKAWLENYVDAAAEESNSFR